MPGSAGQWLDLTGSAITYSDTRLFACLNNVGGDWPNSQGFTTYFVYGIVIANPDTLTLSATAMMYGNIPFILSPGLYHINLADTSFQRLSDISSQTSGNNLHMACDISDLMADPNFPTWPPQSGHIIVAGFTLTITLGTPLFNDYTYPSSFIPETQFLATTGNSSPVVSNASFDIIPNITVNVNCDYSDADNNLPIVKQLLFDRGVFDMGSFDHEYSDTATFSHALAWPGEGMHVYFFRFSDGVSIVETPMDTVYINADGIAENSLPGEFTLGQNYPNPFNAQTRISFSLAAPAEVKLSVYDITGGKVAVLAKEQYEAGPHGVIWDGQNNNGQPVSSGVYFYKLDINGQSSAARKMTLLR